MSKSKKSGKKKVRRMASNVILVCLIGIMIVSGYNLVSSLYKYHIGSKTYNDIAKLAGVEIDTSEDEDTFDGNVDFASLRKQNADTIAWIHLTGTKINYPIVQAGDNDYYLRRMFNGAKGIGGTLFVDYRVAHPFKDFNTIVYGHSMKDKSMFGSLKFFQEQDYADSHSRFDLVTPEGKYRLEVVAFLHIPADNSLYTVVNTSDKAAKANYIQMLKNNASYVRGTFGPDDALVLLSTCAYDYDGARHVVVCKKVPW